MLSLGAVEICHLYISPGHNFVGHHGQEPDDYPMIEVPRIECVAGRGIRGDRYFDFKDDYKGQITFFSLEVFDELRQVLGLGQRSPAGARRNIIVRDVDLNELIDEDFEVQGVRFHGMEECRPCYWMDRAIARGTEEFLKGRGGLRAKILSAGELHSTARFAERKTYERLAIASLLKGEGGVKVLMWVLSHGGQLLPSASAALRRGRQSARLREEETRNAGPTLSAVLLAGGESRRMGRDKATLLFHGKRLWQIQLETLRKLKPAEIFVSARTDRAWRSADVQFVADDPPSRGPLSGLAASLAQMHTAHLLALAVDMPFMSEQYLKFLSAQMEPGIGVVPTIHNRAEPLVAIYPREAVADFRSALASTDFSLQSVVRRLVERGKLREVRVKKHETKLFLNVNELSDAAAL